MSSTSKCPSVEELQRFASSELAPDVAMRVQVHVESCDLCSQTYSDIRDPSSNTVDSKVGPLNESSEEFDLIPPPVADIRAPQPGQATTDLSFLSDPFEPGDLGSLGPYRVLEVLGVGGMGVVFRAEDPKLHRQLALKVIKPELASQPQARERFLREARAIAAINNDHIVTIHQVSDDNVPFLAMPLLEGQTLADQLRSADDISLEETLRIGREIAAGLAAAHQHGIIHRDIKPANIWLEKGTGRVKLLDFGLARAEDEDVELTATGSIAGTPLYMAPERIQSNGIDQRSDLYSLGCVLYRMVAGKTPFANSTLLSVLSAVANETPRPLEEIREDVPAALSGLVMRLLEKEPGERPESADAVIREITNIEASISSPAPHQRTTPESWWRQAPPVAQAAIALLAIGSIALATIVIRIRHKDGSESTINLPDHQVESIGVERDGRRLANVPLDADAAPEPMPFRPSVFDQLEPIPFPPGVPPQPADSQLVAVLGDSRLNHWGPVIAAAFSPDGSLLATGGYDRIVRVWNTKTGEEIHALHGHPGRVRTLAFNADGSRIVSGGDAKKVIVWDVESGKPKLDWMPPAATLELVTFDSNGSPLAVARRPEGIGGWEVTTGTRRFSIAAELPHASQVSLSPDGRSLAVVTMGSHELQVFDTEAGELRFRAPAKANLGTAAMFTPDSKQLAYLAITKEAEKENDHPAKKVVICDAQTGTTVRAFDSRSAATLAISSDGNLLTAGGVYDTRVWDIAAGRELLLLEAHPEKVQAVAIHSTGQLVATGSYDGTIRIWSLESGQELIQRNGHRATVNCLAFSPDGNLLATGGIDRTAVVWNLNDRKPVCQLPEQPGVIDVVRFRPDAKQLAIRSQSPPRSNVSARVTLWESTTGELLNTWNNANGSESDVYIAAERLKVAAVQHSGTLDLVDLKSGQRIPWPESESTFLTARFSPDGTSIAAGTRTGEVLLWTPDSEKPVTRLMRHADQVSHLAFSQNGRYLVSAGIDDKIVVWDFVRNEVVRKIVGAASGISSLAVSADGTRIACSSDKGELRCWYRNEPHPRTLFRFGDDNRHPANRRFTQVAFSPDGRYLATANQNGTAFVFRVAESPASETVDERSQNALKFDGKSSYIHIPSLKYDGSHPITMEAWVTPDRINWGGVVGTSSNYGGITLRQGLGGPTGSQWCFSWRDEEDWKKSEPVGFVEINTGFRSHVALVCNGKRAELFVDGKKHVVVDIQGKIQSPRNTGFFIGAYQYGSKLDHFFSGVIDEVRISKDARYSSNFKPERSFEADDKTMALYHFDEGKGDTVHDSSRNHHDGKIVEAQWVAIEPPADTQNR